MDPVLLASAEPGLIGMLVVLAMVLGGVSVPLLALLIKHRERMAGLKRSAASDSGLEKRVADLERRCGMLEQQVETAHLLLADEQRALDRKLEKILPDAEPGGDLEADADAERQAVRVRG